MKKLLVLLTALFSLAVQCAFAVVAIPKPVTIRQADNSTIIVLLHGDEHFHYTTTSDGYLIVQKTGIFYHALVKSEKITITDIRAHDPSMRGAEESGFLHFKSKGVPQYFKTKMAQRSRTQNMARIGLDMGFPTTGQIRSLILLVNFSDVKFESAAAQGNFEALLNQSGYAENGATGSAKDYYMQNSNNRFTPTFDVVGPVTLPKPTKYYGGNNIYGVDSYPEEMVAEACRLAKEHFHVNFADYDYNQDGLLDNVFVFYAGKNEAEGGGEDTIWPHRSELTEQVTIDGKQVVGYACSSEINLAGQFPTMAGIGTFCHEFGHVLGWPDFYDTDGDEYGLTQGVFDWSLMCSGSYNNEGRTPPAISATERMLVKWLDPEELEFTGNYTLGELQSTNKAYLIKTDTENEFFILENRQNTGWDSYLSGHGLLIFHVDRSDRYVEGSEALHRWNFNTPNNVKKHMCYRIITARPNSGEGYEAYMPFPGMSNNQEFSKNTNPENKSWSGSNIKADLFNIRETDGVISFRAITPKEEIIKVESVEIAGRDVIVLNDTVQLKAVIKPLNAQNKNVTWASSNTQAVTIDQKGVAKAVGAGSATIGVTTEEGGFTAQLKVRTSLTQLFRTRIVNTSAFPLEKVAVTISGDSKEFSGKSDRNGIVCIEDIPEGKYTVALKHPDYPDQQKELITLQGASVCEMILFDKEELQNGTGNYNVLVNEYETSAYVSWAGSKADRWKVEWYAEGNQEKSSSVLTDIKKINIEGLKKSTKYWVCVSEMNDVVEGVYRKVAFTTAEPSSEFSVILLQPLYEKGETILLKAANLPEGATTSWTVDDKETFEVEFETAGPEHKIELMIQNGNNKELITKYISVIE